jgi:hypothetical protein
MPTVEETRADWVVWLAIGGIAAFVSPYLFDRDDVGGRLLLIGIASLAAWLLVRGVRRLRRSRR